MSSSPRSGRSSLLRRSVAKQARAAVPRRRAQAARYAYIRSQPHAIRRRYCGTRGEAAACQQAGGSGASPGFAAHASFPQGRRGPAPSGPSGGTRVTSRPGRSPPAHDARRHHERTLSTYAQSSRHLNACSPPSNVVSGPTTRRLLGPTIPSHRHDTQLAHVTCSRGLTLSAPGSSLGVSPGTPARPAPACQCPPTRPHLPGRGEPACRGLSPSSFFLLLPGLGNMPVRVRPIRQCRPRALLFQPRRQRQEAERHQGLARPSPAYLVAVCHGSAQQYVISHFG